MTMGLHVANIDPLLQRNQRFAVTGAHEGLTVRPRHLVYVITCLDPRVDPSAFLSLDLGDAMVIRNAGGRVSTDVLTELAFIGYLTQMTVAADGPLFEVAIIHHTHCGTGFLADDRFRRDFAARIGADEATLAAQAVTDPDSTVRSDVELVRSATVLPSGITISGHVYDVATGLVTTVVPASPMHAQSSEKVGEFA